MALIFQHDVHVQNLFEVQIIEFNEGTKLHAACICEKVLLRAKAQGTGHGLQIADGFQVVLFATACHTNGIGVVDPDFPNIRQSYSS